MLEVGETWKVNKVMGGMGSLMFGSCSKTSYVRSAKQQPQGKPGADRVRLKAIFDKETENDRVPDWDSIKAYVKYFAYGVEFTPTTNKRHLQAWAYSWKPMRFSQWKKLFPNIKMGFISGTFIENEAYCSKQSDLTEFGVKPLANGEKKGLLDYKRKLDEGASVMDVAEDPGLFETYVRYRNGLTDYKNHIRKKQKQNDRTPPDVYVRIGPAGTGKTRWMDEQYGLDGWVTAPDNNGKWFDGCDRDVILFDDVGPGDIPNVSLWKRLCDRYPFQVPVKGGFITWKPTAIVFTSNHHPFNWWKDLTELDKGAIERRLKEIVVVESDDI